MAETDSIANRMQRLSAMKRRMQGDIEDTAGPAGPSLSAHTESASADDQFEADRAEFDAAFSIEKSDDADLDAVTQAAAEGPGADPDDAVSDTATDDGPVDTTLDIGTSESEENYEAITLGPADSDTDDTDGAPDLPSAVESDEPAAKLDLDHSDIESLNAYFAALGIDQDDEDPVETAEEDEAVVEEAEAVTEAAIEIPDFAAAEVDPEILAREFEHEAQLEETAEPVLADTDDTRLSVTFDESRTAMLHDVAQQMDCSVDDIVVTALDWYLDALYGEEAEAQAV